MTEITTPLVSDQWSRISNTLKDWSPFICLMTVLLVVGVVSILLGFQVIIQSSDKMTTINLYFLGVFGIGLVFIAIVGSIGMACIQCRNK